MALGGHKPLQVQAAASSCGIVVWLWDCFVGQVQQHTSAFCTQGSLDLWRPMHERSSWHLLCCTARPGGWAPACSCLSCHKAHCDNNSRGLSPRLLSQLPTGCRQLIAVLLSAGEVLRCNAVEQLPATASFLCLHVSVCMYVHVCVCVCAAVVALLAVVCQAVRAVQSRRLCV